MKNDFANDFVTINIEATVECPHCCSLNNTKRYVEEESLDEISLEELVRMFLFGGSPNTIFKCPECKGTFLIDEVESDI